VRLQQLLAIELPIIQAPMAGVQDSALAVAVSNAGALGSLPGALLAPEALRGQLRAIRAQTRRPFNVNFFCHSSPLADAPREAAWRAELAPYYAEYGIDASATVQGPARAPFSHEIADVLAEFAPPVVSFHFGLPAPDLMARAKAMGAKILGTATTVAEARWLQARGVDAVIAQGLEAGGHRGMFLSDDIGTQLGSMALLPQVVDAVTCPVIAAGGIADARGIAAAMALGAAGVQLGSAFLRCPEATTSAVHRAALENAAVPTTITNRFSGRPARAIMNRLLRELGPLADMPPFPLPASALAPLRAAAEARGSGDFSPLWAGQNAGACRPIPAAGLVRELARRAR
jgi:nitronate monooxygenase